MHVYYWIILLIIYLLFVLLKAKEGNLNRTVDRIEKKFDAVTIEKHCGDMFEFYNITPIKIYRGKYFSYNMAKNIMTIRDVNKYNFIEMFICFHEIGHYISARTKNTRIINNVLIIIFTISRICLTPFLIIFGVYCIITNHNSMPTNIYFITNVVYLIISMIRIITIPFIEGRANYFAKKFVLETDILRNYKNQEKIISTSCLIAQLNQIVICILYTYINICLFYIINKY